MPCSPATSGRRGRACSRSRSTTTSRGSATWGCCPTGCPATCRWRTPPGAAPSRYSGERPFPLSPARGRSNCSAARGRAPCAPCGFADTTRSWRPLPTLRPSFGSSTWSSSSIPSSPRRPSTPTSSCPWRRSGRSRSPSRIRSVVSSSSARPWTPPQTSRLPGDRSSGWPTAWGRDGTMSPPPTSCERSGGRSHSMQPRPTTIWRGITAASGRAARTSRWEPASSTRRVSSGNPSAWSPSRGPAGPPARPMTTPSRSASVTRSTIGTRTS